MFGDRQLRLVGQPAARIYLLFDSQKQMALQFQRIRMLHIKSNQLYLTCDHRGFVSLDITAVGETVEETSDGDATDRTQKDFV
jgi:hypothetical protein